MEQKIVDEEEKRKQRRIIFRRIYRNYMDWGQLIENEGPIRSILQLVDESVDYYDLMVGYDDLPPRQKEAFTLQYLQGHTEKQASQIMFPEATVVTSVQQYAGNALDRMIEAYDAVQSRELRTKTLEERQEEIARRREKDSKAVEKESRPKEQTEEFSNSIREKLFD